MSLKIISLCVANYMQFAEFEISPSKINLVEGGNNIGKTSLLEAIFTGLTGMSERDTPVMQGKENATIKIGFQNMDVERVINPDGSTKSLKVKKDGSTVKSPQAEINALMDFNRSQLERFDPVKFLQKPEKEQAAIILSMIPITVTPDDAKNWFGEVSPVNYNQHGLLVLKALEEYWYNKRHLCNTSEVIKYSAQVESYRAQVPFDYNVADWENVNLAELYSSVSEAEKQNRYLEEANKLIDSEYEKKNLIQQKYLTDKTAINNQEEEEKAKVSMSVDTDVYNIESEIKSIDDQIRKLQIKRDNLCDYITRIKLGISNKIEAVRTKFSYKYDDLEKTKLEELNLLEERINNAKKYISENSQQDVESIRNIAEEAERMKALVNPARLKLQAEKQLEDAQEKHSKLDSFVTVCRNKPSQLLEHIQIPILGLSIKDGIPLIDGLPMKNLSNSRKITACLDIVRYQLRHAKLKCVLVDRFEELDHATRKELLSQCKNDDITYFFAFVNDEVDANVLKEKYPDIYEQCLSDMELKFKTIGGNENE